MNPMNRIVLASVLLLLSFPLKAGEEEEVVVDVNRRAQEQASAVRTVGSFVFERSAAASFFRQDNAYTELWGQMDWRREDRAFEPAMGDGRLQGAFHVNSYLRLDKHAVAFAGADYENGQKRNVCWNSTSDFAVLRPYVLADSVGGDLQREQYRFYGGYARVDGRVNYGITAAYRAQQEYREVDPRPRNITADLSADLSVGYLWGPCVVGAAGGLRIYKQQQSVDFYDPNGANTSELHFTGLGTFYQRYSGTTYTSVQYRGTGYHLALTLVPRVHDGWYALADYEHLKVDRNLAGTNNTTMTTLTLQTLTAGLAYRQTSKRFDWGVSFKGAYMLRQGKENVLGSGNNTDHQPLLGQMMYDNHGLTVDADGVLTWKRVSGTWSLLPSVVFYRENEEYAYPHRKVEVFSLRGGGLAGYTRLYKNWLFDVKAGGYYTANVDGAFVVPLSDTDSRVYGYVENAYLRRADDWTTLCADVRVQRKLSSNVAVFVSAAYAKHIYGNNLQDDNLHVSVGLCF